MEQKNTLKDELIIRGIKLVDIAYITAIYFFIGMGSAKLMDKIYGQYNKEEYENKSLTNLVLDIILHLSLAGIVIYFARNIVELIPFPLDGVHGFQHKRMKELGSASTFVFAFIFFQNNLQGKLKLLYSKV